jgi:uncharacterized membrane protein HdeD (DUF308 family)
MQAYAQSHHALETPPLVALLARNWWMLLLRGIAAILFGVLAFVWPGVTLATLVLFWGAYVLVDGVLSLISAIRGGGAGSRWWLALVGLAGIAAGIITFAYPGLTSLVLLFVIAFWAIVAGVFEIVGAVKLRNEIENEWMLILAGALSVIFGVIMLMQPAAGALALVWLIAGYAIAFGILNVIFAFRVRRHAAA